MRSQEYEIRLQGTLSEALQSTFAPLVATTESDGAVTVLTGVLADQTELTGILQAISGLGLVLVEVRPARERRPT
jgi:hypothetical protein